MSTELTAPGSSSILNKKIRPSDLILTVLIDLAAAFSILLLGNIFQQFYNMVDTIIVGQYLGEDALAAVGSTGCLMFLVLGFANGIAQGFGVMVSHAFGAKDFKLLKHYVAPSHLEFAPENRYNIRR